MRLQAQPLTLLKHRVKAYLNLIATMAVISPSHTPLKPQVPSALLSPGTPAGQTSAADRGGQEHTAGTNAGAAWADIQQQHQ